MRTSESAHSAGKSSWIRLFSAPALAAAILGGSVLLGASPAEAQAPGMKIAVIDVRRAVLETEQGLRVQATLKKLFDARQVELDAKQRQLQADKEALDKKAQAGKAPQAQLQKDYEALLKTQAELQSTMVEYQREMQRKEQEMTTPILNGVLEIVKRIAAQDGYELVLEKSAVPYFRGDLEVTDKAIQMFNGGQGKPLPKPPAGAQQPPAPPAQPAQPPAKPAPAQPPPAQAPQKK